MNILITGGAGFIGSHLAEYHLSLNDSVIVVDDLSTGKANNISRFQQNDNFAFYHADLLSWPDLDYHLAKTDIVYHMAAVVGMFNVIEMPIKTLHVNIHSTERLMSSIATLDKKPLILVASSSEVYGSKPNAMKESDILLLEATNKSHSSYPISKLCNEICAMAYYKEKNIPAIVTRLFNTTGPRQSSRYGMVLPRFIQQALRNEPLTIFDDGMQTRCFCDVRDLCRMLHALTMTKNSFGQILNVGNDKAITILDLANLVIKITQSKSELQFQQFEDVYGADYINIEHRKPDLTKLQATINYEPQWSLEHTIHDIIAQIRG